MTKKKKRTIDHNSLGRSDFRKRLTQAVNRTEIRIKKKLRKGVKVAEVLWEEERRDIEQNWPKDLRI